ncbi:hypothetical protein [Mucilaginibacter psychrotolerans]|uniref:J domain-containing protein n=1 Tax=Mucilaginibacter psychrotolerans TaxID=1524096 RepID=A0A4Y8SR31_9SPHI|nr:hypothetical protein [Mucilaginibacter psychrotolerans]TFF40816.1 hypothetical protein E2R66_01155 [Mucilaginibacter psychrotolerans]
MKPVVAPKTQTSTKRSKTYIKYEKLLADIERQKQFKINLEEALHKAFSKVNTELSPLIKQSHLLKRDYIIRLDELALEIGIGKINREWIEPYMADELEELLDIFGHEDTLLSKLYEKYANVSIDDVAEDEDVIAMANSLSEILGFEVDPKEILEKGQTAYFEQYRDQIFESLNNRQRDFSDAEEEHSTQKKQKAGSAKKTDETAQLAKDARKIYMGLVKKFHPDLEINADIRDEKNEIIKLVTKAYQENDFFGLLKLHITYMEDNEIGAEANADDMLKRYNKLLQKQLRELTNAIGEIHFSSEAIIADFIDKNGKFSPQKYAARRKALEKQIAAMQADLAGSKKRPKGWFKDQVSMIKDIVQQSMMEGMFHNMFSGFR